MLQPSKSSAPRLLSVRHMVPPGARDFYETALRILSKARVPFVVGGAFALKHYAGVARDTKDLDVFLRRVDLERALIALDAHGYGVQLTFPHWLAKILSGTDFVDVIFNSANGLCPVDDLWFEHAVRATLWDVPVLVCPIEEMIWTKSFVMERERFDGADICHLLEAGGDALDWPHLVRRFGDNWRVLLGHLVFYSFVYPGRRAAVPREVMTDLMRRAARDERAVDPAVCRGTLLSREQYLVDLRERGYADARTPPYGSVHERDIAQWTDAIGKIR